MKRKILFLLSDQILGAYGPKLKELELTGNRLRGVTLDAFEGIDSYELLLAIRDSSLETLPMHFYTMFENVAHWSLDLSNNKLSSLEANTLYQNGTDWKLKGTSMLQGKKNQCCQLFNGKFLHSAHQCYVNITVRKKDVVKCLFTNSKLNRQSSNFSKFNGLQLLLCLVNKFVP